ncbi:peptide-methionine (S)-S-oxide reductase MsrA [Novosphingobium terrae]|uniref:peptide-methionine (S)-S-oxide reductase MsrA n=1 Tax=Novosphingobium terrae TaxID=2726189 RepID=UPI00198145AB|nr:peptide-methionine (S)-S-oxide reductase MsrA [Novosphingobium terrae]
MRPALAAAVLMLAAACSPTDTAQAGGQSRSAAPAGETILLTPDARVPAQEAPGKKIAIFSGGCFWGVEGVFSHVKGVTSAVSGYQGGSASTANYDSVSEGDTGHAESVRVAYDPAVIRYDQLLQIFFSVVADPTQLNRQGPDSGTQYRSALVPQSPEQEKVARAYLAQLDAAHLWKGAVVTRVEPMKGFYPAETYHQDFMLKNPGHPYIQYWDVAKVEGLRKLFPQVYKADFTRN